MKETAPCPLVWRSVVWLRGEEPLSSCLLEAFHLGRAEMSLVEHYQLPVQEEAILNTVTLLNDFFLISIESHFDTRIFLLL